MWRWKQGRCNTRATSTAMVHRSVFTSSTSFLPPLHTHAHTCTRVVIQDDTHDNVCNVLLLFSASKIASAACVPMLL